jgi:hypothetical protein
VHARARTARRAGTAGALAALVLLGVLTGLLGSGVHLARASVLGVLVPHGVLLALALVVACDVAVGAAGAGRRPGPGRALLAVAAGRGLAVGVLLLPRPEGDVVLTGLPASTVWILASVLLPAFAAPMCTAVAVGSRSRAQPTVAAAR